MNPESLLILGIDPTPIATSASKAGYRVYAIDYFGDQDLKKTCIETLSIIHQKPHASCGRLGNLYRPTTLLKLTETILAKYKVDAALLSSGLDDSLEILSELNTLIPILGNTPETIRRVRDKPRFFEELREIGILCPATEPADSLEEAAKRARDLEYPVVLKPAEGSGGVGIRRADSPNELERAYRGATRVNKRVLVQKYVDGTPASVSLISARNRVRVLTVNEQLLGLREVCQLEPFGWCGNIVPLKASKTVIDRCRGVAEEVASHFSLVGSNGIDLTISQGEVPYVIEVNPRFQGTLECVERVLGISVVQAHVEACIHGTLPQFEEKESTFSTRLIVFAPKRSEVPDLTGMEWLRDIPLPGVIVESGEPVCSVMAEGESRDSSLRAAIDGAKAILGTLQAPHPRFGRYGEVIGIDGKRRS